MKKKHKLKATRFWMEKYFSTLLNHEFTVIKWNLADKMKFNQKIVKSCNQMP